MNAKLRSMLLPILVGGLAVAQPASAQNLPESIDPGRVDEFLRDDRKAPTAPPAQIEVQPQRGEIPPGAETITFVLQGLIFEGATVTKDEAFLDLYQKYLNEEISLKTVYEIAAAVTARLRDDGLVLSRVVVPPQTIDNGLVRLQIIEGFIESYEIQGEAPNSGFERLEGMAKKVVASRPLRAEDLERYLLLMNDLPGLSVRGVLSPSPTTPGAAVLTLIVEEDAIDGSLTLDNRGTVYFGPYQVTAGFSANSPLGQNERFDFVTLLAPDNVELAYFQGGYAQPIGTEGTTATISASHSSTKPGFDLRALNIQGSSTNVILGVDHPIIRSREENLRTNLSFDYLNSETEIFGNQLLTLDRIRSLRLGAEYERVDAWRGLTTVEGVLSKGLDILAARDEGSRNLSRASGEAAYVKVEGSASRLQGLFGGFSLFTDVGGQYSADKLLSSEEFGIGGFSFGRGYDSSEITGDVALAASLELRFDDVVPDDSFLPLQSYQLFSFIEGGKAWNNDPQPGDQPSDSLFSLGGGVRATIFDNAYGTFEITKPLTRDVETEGNRNVRLFFSVSAFF